MIRLLVRHPSEQKIAIHRHFLSSFLSLGLSRSIQSLTCAPQAQYPLSHTCSYSSRFPLENPKWRLHWLSNKRQFSRVEIFIFYLVKPAAAAAAAFWFNFGHSNESLLCCCLGRSIDLRSVFFSLNLHHLVTCFVYLCDNVNRTEWNRAELFSCLIVQNSEKLFWLDTMHEIERTSWDRKKRRTLWCWWSEPHWVGVMPLRGTHKIEKISSSTHNAQHGTAHHVLTIHEIDWFSDGSFWSR